MTPVVAAELHQLQPLQRVRAVCERQLALCNRLTVNLGRPLRVLRPAEEERAEVRLELLLRRPQRVGEYQQPGGDRSAAIAAGPALPSEREPDRHALEAGQEQLGAPRRLRLGRLRRRPYERARRLRCRLRAEFRQRHLQRPVQSAASTSSPRSRRLRTCRRCRSTSITAGPFGGVAGVTQDDSGRQPAPHRPEHRDGLRAFLRRLVAAASSARTSRRSVEYTGSRGRKLYDLADPNKRGAALVYLGTGGATARPNPHYGAFNTRGNRGQSQYHGVTFGVESRQLGNTGLQLNGSYTLGRRRTISAARSATTDNNFNLGIWMPSTRCSITGTRSSTCGIAGALSGIWKLPFFKECVRRKACVPRRLADEVHLHREDRYPFTLCDCTNGSLLCMRAEDPIGIEPQRDRRPARQPERVQAARPHAAAAATPAATCNPFRARATSVRIRRT